MFFKANKNRQKNFYSKYKSQRDNNRYYRPPPLRIGSEFKYRLKPSSMLPRRNRLSSEKERNHRQVKQRIRSPPLIETISLSDDNPFSPSSSLSRVSINTMNNQFRTLVRRVECQEERKGNRGNSNVIRRGLKFIFNFFYFFIYLFFC